MNSTHCSRATTALVFVALVLAAVGSASAFAVDGLPGESQVGEEVTLSHTIEDPFTDAPNQWTMEGATEMENVRWTVTVNRAGAPISEETYTDQRFNQTLDVENNGDEVIVELDGTTPGITNYTYAPEERYQAIALHRTTGNNSEELVNESVHHFTEDSDAARTAIEDAEAAIDEAGGQEEAEQLVGNAQSSYEAEDFQNAVSLANQAQDRAEQAQQSQQTTQMLLTVGGAVLVLALLGGGVYYWRSRQDEYSKL